MTRGLIATAVLAGVASAQTPTKPPPPPPDHQHMPGMSMPGMDMGMPPVDIPKGAIFTEADVRFMQGMIAHHAQAIYMSRLAAGRQANARVLKFANKIDQSQVAEIHLMQDWLRANKQFVPDTSSWRTMHMPGMLTDAQLAELDAARGAQFDRLFLTYMIQHHRGAVSMVKELFSTQGAGQDETVFKFASDVNVDQSTEIARMEKMLAAMPPA